MPFTPSHVEALSRDGTGYIGAHIDGGVEKRSIGYDKGQLARIPKGYDVEAFPSGICELFLKLEATPEQDAAFHAFLESKIGTPYDWKAILGFVLPRHEHTPDSSICSALTVLALRASGWLRWRLAAPAHLVDPRDLLLILSTHMQIPGV